MIRDPHIKDMKIFIHAASFVSVYNPGHRCPKEIISSLMAFFSLGSVTFQVVHPLRICFSSCWFATWNNELAHDDSFGSRVISIKSHYNMMVLMRLRIFSPGLRSHVEFRVVHLEHESRGVTKHIAEGQRCCGTSTDNKWALRSRKKDI